MYHSFLDTPKSLYQTDRNVLQSASSDASIKKLLQHNLSLGLPMPGESGMPSSETRTSLKLDNQHRGQPTNSQVKEDKLLSSCSVPQRNEGILLNVK